jgi:hypothetical protein
MAHHCPIQASRLATCSVSTAIYLHTCPQPYCCITPHQHRLTSPTPHISPFRCPIALSSYHPNPTHDSSAPRRQLDGGLAPATDGRGGGRARPGSPCCRAVLVGWSPRRRLPGGASSRHPAVGRCRRGRQGQDASHGVGRRSASTRWCPLSGSVVRVRRSSRPVSGRLVSGASGVRPSGVRCVRRPAVRRPAGRSPAVRRPAGCCPPPSVRTRPSRPPQAAAVGTRSRRKATVTTGTGRVPVGCRVLERLDGRPTGPDAGDAAEVAWSVGSVADPGQVG